MALFDSKMRGWNDRMSTNTNKVFVNNKINYGIICDKSKIDEVHKTEFSKCIFSGPCWSSAVYRTKKFNLYTSTTESLNNVKWRPKNYKFANIDTNFYINTSNVINKQTIPYSNTYQMVSNDEMYQYKHIEDIESAEYDDTEIIMNMRDHFLKYVNDFVTYEPDSLKKIKLTYNNLIDALSSSLDDSSSKIVENPTVRDSDTGIIYEIKFNGSEFILGDSIKNIQILDDDGVVISETETTIMYSGDIIIRDELDDGKFWKLKYDSTNGFTYQDLGESYYHDKHYPELNTDMVIPAKVYQAPYIDWYNESRKQKNRVFYHLGFDGEKVILPAIKLQRDQTIHSFEFKRNKLNNEYYTKDNFGIVLWNNQFEKLATIRLKDGLEIQYDSTNNWLQILSGHSDYYDPKYYGHNDMAEPLRISFDTMIDPNNKQVNNHNTWVYMTFERLDGIYDFDLIDLYRCLQWEVTFPAHTTNAIPTTNLYMRPEFRDPIKLGNIQSFGADKINSVNPSSSGTGYHTGMLGFKLKRHNAHEYRIFVQNDLPGWFEDKYNVTEINLYDNEILVETQKYITFIFHYDYDEYIIHYVRDIIQYTRTRMWTQLFLNQLKYKHNENYGEIQLLLWQLPINNSTDHPAYVDGMPTIYSTNISSWVNHGQHSNLSMTRSSMIYSHPAMSLVYWFGYTRMNGNRATREFRYSGFQNKTTCGARIENCEIPILRYAYKIKDGSVKYIPIDQSHIGECNNSCGKYSYTSSHIVFKGTTFPGSTYIETQDQQLSNNPQQTEKSINNNNIDLYMNYKNENYSMDSKSVAIPTEIALWGKKMPLDINNPLNADSLDLLLQFPFTMVEAQAERERFGIGFLDQYIYENMIIGKIEILYKIIKGLQSNIMYFDNYKEIISLNDYQITNKNDYIFEDIPLISHQGSFIQGKSLYLRIPMGHKSSIDFNEPNDISFTVKDKKPRIDKTKDVADLLNGSINYDYYSENKNGYINTSQYVSDYRTPIIRT